jgi:hypothetical protein
MHSSLSGKFKPTVLSHIHAAGNTKSSQPQEPCPSNDGHWRTTASASISITPNLAHPQIFRYVKFHPGFNEAASMLEWFVSHGSATPWEQVPTFGMDREQIEEAFRVDAKAGRCRGRHARCMLLIDAGTEQHRVVAYYGNPPPQLPDRVDTYVIDDGTERFPMK